MNIDEKLESKVIKGLLIWMVFATIVAGILTIYIKRSEAAEQPNTNCVNWIERRLPCGTLPFPVDP